MTIKFMIPNSRMGSVIGKQGSKIKEIQDASGARLNASEGMLPGSTEVRRPIAGSHTSDFDLENSVCSVLLGLLTPYTSQLITSGIFSLRRRNGCLLLRILVTAHLVILADPIMVALLTFPDTIIPHLTDLHLTTRRSNFRPNRSISRMTWSVVSLVREAAKSMRFDT